MIDCIHTDIIPHAAQIYNTSGNYWAEGSTWQVRISKTDDWRHSYLVLIHELVEMALTKHHNVSWDDIDEFDINGEGSNHPDPGTLASAPYHNEHVLATQIEKKVAKMLGINWKDYNDALDALEYKQ